MVPVMVAMVALQQPDELSRMRLTINDFAIGDVLMSLVLVTWHI